MLGHGWLHVSSDYHFLQRIWLVFDIVTRTPKTIRTTVAFIFCILSQDVRECRIFSPNLYVFYFTLFLAGIIIIIFFFLVVVVAAVVVQDDAGLQLYDDQYTHHFTQSGEVRPNTYVTDKCERHDERF